MSFVSHPSAAGSGWTGAIGPQFSEDNTLLAAAVYAANLAPDTEAPTGSITAPVYMDTVSGTVTVTVSATDNVGVDAVEVYADGVLVGSDNSAPYAVPWDTTLETEGWHDLTAVIADAATNEYTTAAVRVYVDNVPDAPSTGDGGLGKFIRKVGVFSGPRRR